jgi:hypothetical protein
VTWLDPAAHLSFIAGDLLKARLPHRAQREMIIKQAAQQLPPANIKMLLKLGMREAGSVRSVKKADQRLEPLAAGGKGSAAVRIARRAAVAASRCGCIFAVSPCGRQDLIARGVKFATTGVEIGRPVSTPRTRMVGGEGLSWGETETGGTSPGPPGDPLTQMARCANGQSEARPAARPAQNGTRRPPQ